MTKIIVLNRYSVKICWTNGEKLLNTYLRIIERCALAYIPILKSIVSIGSMGYNGFMVGKVRLCGELGLCVSFVAQVLSQLKVIIVFIEGSKRTKLLFLFYHDAYK